MKLKRMWPGLCILIVFMIFDVIMVASSSFFSGLFPSGDMKLVYSAILTVLGVLIMSVLTFLLGRICDHIELEGLAHTVGVRVIYALMLIAIFVGGIFYRLDILSRTTYSPSGKLSLFENAQVGVTSVADEYDLLSVAYTDILKFVMYFTGNKIIAAYGLQIALFMLFVILGTVTCKMLLGKAASVVFAGYVSFMPVFTEGLSKAVIGTDEVFLVMLGIELLIIGIYLKDISDGNYTSKWFIIWYLIIGIFVGFMTYLDAGTIIAVAPLLLSAMFMAGDKKHVGAFSLIFVILSGVITFFGMIAQEAGFMQMGKVLHNWSGYYFRNLNTFSMFWTYTNYKLVYVITFIAMSGVLVGYFRNKNFGRISPWLLSTILVFVATPFFGATRMNDQNVVTVFFAFVLACVVSLITLTRQEAVFSETAVEEALDEADASEEDGPENNERIREIVMPFGDEDAEYVPLEKKAFRLPDEVRIEEVEETEEPKEVEEVKETEKEEVKAEVKAEVKETKPVEKTTEETTEKTTGKTEEKPRFVPEGMILPTGAEEEMDVDKTKMRMSKFEGKIGLDRKKSEEPKKEEIKKEKHEKVEQSERKVVFRKRTEYRTAHVEEPVQNKKDDFDIPYSSGDDFDI